MDEFSVSSQTDAGVAVAALSGVMDALASDMVEEEFGRLMESAVTGVVLDLAGLKSLTSAAAGAIVNLNVLLAKRGGKLVLAATPAELLGLLELLGLGEILAFADSVDAARKIVSSK